MWAPPDRNWFNSSTWAYGQSLSCFAVCDLHNTELEFAAFFSLSTDKDLGPSQVGCVLFFVYS